MPRALDARPMADIRPEGEGAEDQIILRHARPTVDFDPAPQKRLPIFGSIEPPERAPGRPRRLVQIAVARKWVSEQSAVRRMFELFSRQFALGREGQRAQISRPARFRHFHPSKAEFLLVKPIRRDFREQRAEPLVLPCAQLRATWGLRPAIVKIHSRPLPPATSLSDYGHFSSFWNILSSSGPFKRALKEGSSRRPSQKILQEGKGVRGKH